MRDVSIVACDSYDEGTVLSALRAVLQPIDGLGWVKPGMTVAIKANLISAMKPDAAATTHPALIAAMVRLLAERGASAIVGDSPGGPFTAAFLAGVYRAVGLKAAEDAGARLNRDFSVKEAEYPQAVEAKKFEYTAWLDSADAIIDLCKLKTHGMMAMTGAAKNLFGVIPGLTKGAYHYRFPDETRFAEMIVDLNAYFKPRLCVTDAVYAMEGNGPTQGTPRKIGALLACECPHSVDLLSAKLIGLTVRDVPTLAAAVRRGLIPEQAEALTVYGDPEAFVCADFERIRHFHAIEFYGTGRGKLHRFMGRAARLALETKPAVRAEECIGCGKCAQICPAGAIVMEKRLPRIDRKKCIRCFCCQELCPKGAMKPKRPALARALDGARK